jgi:chorismate mutase
MGSELSIAQLEGVRREIDAIDRALIRLLSRRLSLVEMAAQIKQHPRLVSDPDRNDRVLANIRRAAGLAGYPEAMATRIWDLLLAMSIRHQIDFLARPAGRPATGCGPD